MRISDWSSDVCSSDLLPPPVFSLHAPTGDAFDFEPLLTEALAPLRRRATIKRIALRCTVPAGPPRLCADRSAVLRRIRNLLSQVLEGTDRGGAILCATDRERKRLNSSH